MIRNIFDLTKIFLIGAFHRNPNKKKRSAVLRIVLYVGLFLYLAGVFGYLSYEMLKGLIALKQEKAFTGLILMAIVTLTMFTTIISVMNVLYFSDDNRFVLPLPLKPVEILSSKLNVLLIYVYFEELMLAAVPLLMYGYMTKQGLIYYPFMVVVLLTVPVVPLLITALIVMGVMALTKGIRNKTLVQMITMSVSVILSLMVSFVSSSVSSQEDAMALMNKANGLLDLYKKSFVTMPMAVDALANQNFVSLSLLILVSLVFYVLVCLLGQKIYYRGMLGSLYSSSGVSNRKLDEKSYESKGLLFSYVMKEFRIYLRNPTFFTQLILPCLILPAFISGILYVSVSSSAGEEVFQGLDLIYSQKEFGGYIFGVLLLGVMFLSMYSFISSVAVSKDGHDAYAMKYLPVSFCRQLICKMMPDILMCLFAYVSGTVLLTILFKIPAGYVLLSVPVVFLYCILHGFLILTDVRKPRLDWSSEMQVTKNNLRTVFSMGLAFLNMGLVAVLAFLLELSAPLMAAILSVLYLTAVILLYSHVRKKDIALADGFE